MRDSMNLCPEQQCTGYLVDQLGKFCRHCGSVLLPSTEHELQCRLIEVVTLRCDRHTALANLGHDKHDVYRE